MDDKELDKVAHDLTVLYMQESEMLYDETSLSYDYVMMFEQIRKELVDKLNNE